MGIFKAIFLKPVVFFSLLFKENILVIGRFLIYLQFFSSKSMSVQVKHSFQILEGHLPENSNVSSTSTNTYLEVELIN